MRSPLDLLTEIEDPKLPDESQYIGEPSGIVSLQEFMARKVPEPPQILFGVLRAGQVGIIASGSKAGKTWLMQSLGLAVATGRMWLAWKTMPGRVLYIDPELPHYDGQSRIQKLIDALGLPSVPANMDYWRVKGKRLSIADIERTVALRMKETGEPFALILVDSIYCFGDGRDENDNSAQAVTMQELYSLSEMSGAAVMLAHHFSKGFQNGKHHIDRMSGAGVFARAPDAIMSVTELEEEGCYRVETTVRSFARPKDFSVRWEYPLWTIDESLDGMALKTPQNAQTKKADARRDQLVGLLQTDCGLSNAEWEAKAKNALLWTSERTWTNDVIRLKTDPRVREKDGRYYRAEA